MNTKPFLQIVAEDLYRRFGDRMDRVAVVFPNNRAKLFLNESLGHIAGKPLWSPSYLSISDLFERQTQLRVADDLQLVAMLYGSYLNIIKGGEGSAAESLDDFYGWGQLLLSDYDDIDKHLAPARKVFQELENYHELDADPELSAEQKQALKEFFSNYDYDHETRLKQRFHDFWVKLYPIYEDFRKRLLNEGLAYEGMLQRVVAEQEHIKLHYDTYVFVGFNMLQEVEKALFRRIGRERQTLFYWDYDFYYMNHETANEAGRFVADNIREFGNALPADSDAIYNNFSKPKQISFVSAQTSSVQSHYVSTWLAENQRAEAGEHTAIVMCDETLLPSLVHSLPKSAGNVNITTGFPLNLTPAYSFVQALIALQAEGNPGHGDGYRMHQVREVLSHPFARRVSPKAETLLNDLIEAHVSFPSREQLSLDEGLKALFRPVYDNSEAEPNLLLLDYLRGVVALAGAPEEPEEDEEEPTGDPLSAESIFRMYTLLNRLYGLTEQGYLPVNETTLRRLFTTIAQTTSIPYEGEPVSGLQVMGVLETRNLDFDHLLVLSCNEDNMPKGITDASFIPYAVRKAYGLTTTDNKVAIFAFYFYRLLQRATDITLCYSSSTQGTHVGEMSRFMRQIMVESQHEINLKAIHTGSPMQRQRDDRIEKRPEFMSRLMDMERLSPTAINNYMRCQLLFFYKYVMGVREPDSRDLDQMDQRDFGNIFHKACENLYRPYVGRQVTAEVIREMKKPQNIRRQVEQAFLTEYLHVEKPSRNFSYSGSQLIILRVVAQYVERLLEKDERLAPFTILALEKETLQDYTIKTDEGEKLLKLGGMIDRLDMVASPDGTGSVIRVIDYKTGGRPSGKPAGVDDIFDPERSAKTHGDYYLQALLYSLNVARSPELNPQRLKVSPALLYIREASADDYDPVLEFGKERISDAETFRDDYESQLTTTLEGLFSSGNPFTATANHDTCQTCAFRQLCGR